MQMISAWGCMLDIIWNAVEDEYLTVIMYLLCSIPMRFSGKTSQMIHNCRAKGGSRRDQREAQDILARASQARIVAREDLDYSCFNTHSPFPGLRTDSPIP